MALYLLLLFLLPLPARFESQLINVISTGTIHFGCGQFQYYNASFDMKNPPSIISSAFSKINDYLERLVVVSHVPSLSFGIVYNNATIYYKSYGRTTLNNSVSDNSPTSNSIYRIGSISKVFTVLLAYIFRDNNKLSMTDTIHKYNNNFSIHNPWGYDAADKSGHTITLKQLASQISGLPREPPCVWEQDDCLNITTNEILSRLSKQYLTHPTDVQASYSNLAYGILGNILCEYNGYKSFEQCLTELILKPLDLHNTGLYLTEMQRQYAATGYDRAYGDTGYVDIGWVAPCGQMFSTVDDLAILMEQYFAAFPSRFKQHIDESFNFLISPSSYREMLRPVYMNPDLQSGYGSPFEMQMLNGHYLRGKGGNINGFAADIQFIPEMKLGVIAMANYEVDASQFTFSTLEILIPAFKAWLNSMQTQFTSNLPISMNSTDYVGYYMLSEVPFFHVFIDAQTGNIMLHSSVEMVYGVLNYLENNTFIYNALNDDTISCWSQTLTAADGVTVEFQTNSDGQVIGATVPAILYGTFLPKKNQKGLSWNKTKQNKTCFPSFTQNKVSSKFQ